MSQDPDNPNTLIIDAFAGEDSLIHACCALPCRELVLRGKAKEMFATVFARALNHLPAFDFIDKNHVIVGYRIAYWRDGDPNYLGMAACRIWFKGGVAWPVKEESEIDV